MSAVSAEAGLAAHGRPCSAGAASATCAEQPGVATSATATTGARRGGVGTAGTTRAAVAVQPAAAATGRTSPAAGARPAGTAEAASADQPSPAAGPTDPAGSQTVQVGAADTAGPAAAVQPSAAAAGTAGSTVGGGRRTAGTADATVSNQTGVTAGAAGLSGRAARARASVAVQQTAGTAGRTRGAAVRAVADQRAPQQRIGGRVDHTEDGLPESLQRCRAGGFGQRVGACARRQVLQEQSLEVRRLRTDGLIRLTVGAEQRRDGGRHLVLRRSKQVCGGRRRCRVGRFQRGPNAGQIGSCRRQNLRRCD